MEIGGFFPYQPVETLSQTTMWSIPALIPGTPLI